MISWSDGLTECWVIEDCWRNCVEMTTACTWSLAMYIIIYMFALIKSITLEWDAAASSRGCYRAPSWLRLLSSHILLVMFQKSNLCATWLTLPSWRVSPDQTLLGQVYIHPKSTSTVIKFPLLTHTHSRSLQHIRNTLPPLCSSALSLSHM